MSERADAGVRMRRARTDVDLAGERKVGVGYAAVGAGFHGGRRDPSVEETATARERTLWRILDGEMRERDYLQSIIDLLRTELALYRPEPGAALPAPKVPGYWLVTVAGRGGLCYAKDVVTPYPVPGANLPDFHHPAVKTLCGLKTLGPGSIPGYGWPPASMVCAGCRSKLPEGTLFE